MKVADISVRCGKYISFSLNLTLVPVEENFEVHTCPMVVTENLFKFTFGLAQCLSNRKFQSPQLSQCPNNRNF